MRILIVANKGSNHAKKVAEGLAGEGLEVYFVSPNDEIDKTVTLCEKIKLTTLPFGGKSGYILNLWALKRLIKRIRPDVVNVHYASGCGLLAYLAGIHPTVLSCYGSDIFEFPHISKFNRWLLLLVLKSADAIASTSHGMADEIRNLLAEDAKDITITPFGIDTKLFKPQIKKNNNNIRIIGIVKTLSPIYDVQLLIKSFKLVCDNTQFESVLRIYGEGPQKQELQKLTRDLGISNKVEFLGRIANDKVPEVINEMDVFVNSSKQESFGVNVLEAMACGVPVVATDCVGPRELIVDGVTGYIVKDRLPQTMCDAIISLLSNDAQRENMGRAGRDRVCRYYDWNDNVKQLKSLLIDNSLNK